MSDNAHHQKVVTLGIIGGGRGGLGMLGIFGESDLTRIDFICDLNNDAPAMKEARSRGIATVTDIKEALARNVDVVIEATRLESVVKTIREHLPPKSKLIENSIALFVVNVLTDIQNKTNKSVVADMTGIQTQLMDSQQQISKQVNAIKSITNGLLIIGLNARVEAARLGDQGNGFDVVAQEIQRMAATVRQTSDDIATVNQCFVELASAVDESLKRLDQR
jgi:hypothetical protein